MRSSPATQPCVASASATDVSRAGGTAGSLLPRRARVGRGQQHPLAARPRGRPRRGDVEHVHRGRQTGRRGLAPAPDAEEHRSAHRRGPDGDVAGPERGDTGERRLGAAEAVERPGGASVVRAHGDAGGDAPRLDVADGLAVQGVAEAHVVQAEGLREEAGRGEPRHARLEAGDGAQEAVPPGVAGEERLAREGPVVAAPLAADPPPDGHAGEAGGVAGARDVEHGGAHVLRDRGRSRAERVARDPGIGRHAPGDGAEVHLRGPQRAWAAAHVGGQTPGLRGQGRAQLLGPDPQVRDHVVHGGEVDGRQLVGARNGNPR